MGWISFLSPSQQCQSSEQGIWPVKTEWWGAGVVICLERGAAYGPADATATHCLFSKIQIGFTFLVPAYWQLFLRS